MKGVYRILHKIGPAPFCVLNRSVEFRGLKEWKQVKLGTKAWTQADKRSEKRLLQSRKTSLPTIKAKQVEAISCHGYNDCNKRLLS